MKKHVEGRNYAWRNIMNKSDKNKKHYVSIKEIKKQKEYMNVISQINKGKEKKFNIETFGCQLNENDSEKIAGMCMEMGYKQADKREEADLVIINTCCIRENAENKVYGHLGELKKQKLKNPGLIITVCGCMMQQKHVVENIKKSFMNVDLIFGTHNIYKFPYLLYKKIKGNKNIYEVSEDNGYMAEGLPIKRVKGVKAMVTVMYGCNNYCTYCVVPFVRGREKSRTPLDIIREVETAVENKFVEIILLGQNVNSYGNDLDDNISFARLLNMVNEIKGVERIRFMTSHPKDISTELISSIMNCKKVCEHLHLPIQSGSTRILKKMNRKYTKEHYMGLIEKIKKEIPDISLTTDIIVGFPGETEDDFEETLDVIRKVRYDSAYTFLFSKRAGTPAAKFSGQIPEEVKKKRFKKLIDEQNKISREINENLLDKVFMVLVEGKSKKNPDAFTGRTRTNKIVNFKSERELTGKFVEVKINRALTWSLEGEFIE
jgi:tRNA-2-methylthio-N6-dimethylallyladenosine synthase